VTKEPLDESERGEFRSWLKILQARLQLYVNCDVLSGSALGITDQMEAWPQHPLLILQARPRDEGVRPCDSDLFFPFFG